VAESDIDDDDTDDNELETVEMSVNQDTGSNE
jgi:hypothetical protein